MPGQHRRGCRCSRGHAVHGPLWGRYVRRDDRWAGFVRRRDARARQAPGICRRQTLAMESFDVTLVKAYMEGLATSKNSTVVLRVRYGRAGEAIGDATFRGDHTDVNWGSGDGEAREFAEHRAAGSARRDRHGPVRALQRAGRTQARTSGRARRSLIALRGVTPCAASRALRP